MFGFRVVSNSFDSDRQEEINKLKKENEKNRFLLSDKISRKKQNFLNFTNQASPRFVRLVCT